MKGQISESILYMQIPLPKNASNCAITKGLETILPIEHQHKILDPKLISTNIPPVQRPFLLHSSSHLTSINDIFSAPSTYLIPIINKSTHSLARAFTYLCCTRQNLSNYHNYCSSSNHIAFISLIMHLAYFLFA